jgi:predicted DNA-binding transcriptional regulator YafY
LLPREATLILGHVGSQELGAGRNAQLVRLLGILRDLDRLGGVDVYALAERHRASVRTIRRDLEALSEVGLPLRQEQDGKKKRWFVEYRHQLGKLSALLDVSHYLALKVAMEQAGAIHRSTATFAALEDLTHKIEQALGKKHRKDLAAIEACFHSYEKFAYQRSKPDLLLPIICAISERRLCEVTYRTPRRRVPNRFEILPLKLFVHQAAVYLMCHVPKHDDVSTLNLHRLERLLVLEERADPPEGFDPERLENAAFGVFSGGAPTRYVLQFERSVAPFIRERMWHPSQRLRELRGGRVELELNCGASYEVRSWVASWGEAALVLEPAWLRDELADLGAHLQAVYGLAERKKRSRRRAPSPEKRAR